MRKSSEVCFLGECEVEVTGYCTPGCRERGPSYASGGEPAEPPEVEDLYVGVIIRGASIDITALLNSKQKNHFEEILLEKAEDLSRPD